MPEFIRTPYAPDQRTMLDLMRLASADRSRSDQQRAQVRAQGILNIGQLIAGTLAGIQQEREQKAALAMKAEQQARDDAFKMRDQQLREADLIARVADREQASERQRVQDQRQAQMDAEKRGSAAVADMGGYGPLAESQVDDVMQSPAAGRTRYSFGPGMANGPEVMPNAQQMQEQHARTAIQGMGGQIGPNGQVIMPPKPEREPNPTEASLAMAAAKGDKMAAQALATLQRMKKSDNAPERPSVWISKGDEMRFVTPSQAAQLSAQGWRSGNTREQGRPVTSGDAGRIADLDTSLDDLGVLENTVTGSTGTSAKIGAMLPNWVSELTGRGVSAKQKQASIDRVKQVIGKALEGGVLRKEDEIKYEKILPTIYDTPEVVASKLQGLKEALTLRRQTTIDALSDAGYDVTRYNERGKNEAVLKPGQTVNVGGFTVTLKK